MTDSSSSYEKSFLEWLERQVSPSQLSAIFSVFININKFCLSRKILKKPLFETDDLVTLSNVRKTVERNRFFAFSYRKQKSTMITAIQYYCRFIKDAKDNSSLIEPTSAPNGTFQSLEQDTPANKSLLDFLIANNISFIDNRKTNGYLWMIGGQELKEIADKCSARGVIFHFEADGAKSVNNYPAWWTTDDFNSPAESELTVPVADNVVELQPKTELLTEATVPDVSEIQALLSEEVFSPLKDVLTKENIRTIEELKALKLWAFMNQNNLYSISMRQVVLTKVRQLLEPEIVEKPELLYELHCGSTIYSGDTLAKTFLYFCEDTARRYPLFFRSLLDKPMGKTSDVKIYRSPENGNFIRMENPTCYISTDLAKDSVVSAVEWIMQRCASVKMSVSVKEPDALLTQTSDAEIPQKEPPDISLDEHNQPAIPAAASMPDKTKQGEPAAHNTNEQRLNLAESRSLAYTKPTGCSYKGKIISCTSWNELYVKLVRELYSDYESLFQSEMSFAGSSRVDLGSRTRMIYPRAIKNDIYLECNVSATGIASKIRWLLEYCSVNSDDVVITYYQQNSGNYWQSSQTESCNKEAPARTNVSQETESVDLEKIAKVEKVVLDADMNGITCDGLCNALRLTMVATKTLMQQCKRIVEIKGKLYHEDAFVDWDEGAKRMCLILDKLMQKNNGYVSAVQLYDYARVEMNMFLNDNDLSDERSVYEIAQHLFEKNNFEGHQYSFTGKAHISRSEDAINSIFDVICKYAEDQGGVFREDDLKEYLAGVGIKTGNLRNQMRLGKEAKFFFYEPGTIISTKSMKIDDSWKEGVGRALKNLLNDADGHIVLRQIQPVWYESLPALPGSRRWTPLLLQFVLQFYGEEFGAKTIIAMHSQNMDTLHAMLVKADGPIQNFGDAVIAYLMESEIEQRSFQAEELRQLLVKTGMIQGNELIWNMPKALAKDERFAWDAKGENVIIRV